MTLVLQLTTGHDKKYKFVVVVVGKQSKLDNSILRVVHHDIDERQMKWEPTFIYLFTF